MSINFKRIFISERFIRFSGKKSLIYEFLYPIRTINRHINIYNKRKNLKKLELWWSILETVGLLSQTSESLCRILLSLVRFSSWAVELSTLPETYSFLPDIRKTVRSHPCARGRRSVLCHCKYKLRLYIAVFPNYSSCFSAYCAP